MNEDVKKHVVYCRYWCSDVVYLRVCDEAMRGMVTSVNIHQNDTVTYLVMWANKTETWHYDCELSSEFLPNYGEAQSAEKTEGDAK
jgi:hypothetical protein